MPFGDHILLKIKGKCLPTKADMVRMAEIRVSGRSSGGRSCR
jgi:hypothetical protein